MVRRCGPQVRSLHLTRGPHSHIHEYEAECTSMRKHETPQKERFCIWNFRNFPEVIPGLLLRTAYAPFMPILGPRDLRVRLIWELATLHKYALNFQNFNNVNIILIMINMAINLRAYLSYSLSCCWQCLQGSAFAARWQQHSRGYADAELWRFA